MAKIQVKRGPKANLPVLDVGEPAFTTDTKEVFFGSSEGNISLVGSDSLAEKAKYQAATGSNTIAITTGGSFAYTQGNWVKWIQASANTGAVTIDIDAVGAKALKNDNGNALVAGDLETGKGYEAYYSLGDDFFILPPKGAKLDGIIAEIEAWGGVVAEPQKASDVENAIQNVANWDADLVEGNVRGTILGVTGTTKRSAGGTGTCGTSSWSVSGLTFRPRLIIATLRINDATYRYHVSYNANSANADPNNILTIYPVPGGALAAYTAVSWSITTTGFSGTISTGSINSSNSFTWEASE